MRRLRAVAAIVALAVIWLGYSVARQIAAELGTSVPQQSEAIPQAESPGAQSPSRTSSQATVGLGPLSSPPAGASIASADLPGESGQAAASGPNSPTNTPFVNPLPGSSDQEPFQSASFTAPAVMSGSGGSFRRGASGGSVPHAGGSGGGFGGGGGSTASASESGSGDAESGNGRPELLGRRLASETSESSVDTGSNGKSGDSGSSGGNGSNGNDSSDGDNDSKGNSGSNGDNGSNGGNGSSGDDGSNGSSGANGSNKNNGSNGSNDSESGNDTGTADESNGGSDTARTAALSIEDTDEPLTIPEPGSILMALGAAALVARRRTR